MNSALPFSFIFPPFSSLLIHDIERTFHRKSVEKHKYKDSK